MRGHPGGVRVSRSTGLQLPGSDRICNQLDGSLTVFAGRHPPFRRILPARLYLQPHSAIRFSRRSPSFFHWHHQHKARYVIQYPPGTELR